MSLPRPKKRLSQNFLTDKNVVEKLLDAAEIQPGDAVLEIGPGPGAITEALVTRGAAVTAVELDSALAEKLKRLPITIHHADILKFPLTQPGKVVSNLPFQITVPILERLLPRRDLFPSITVICQEEMARRITAQPKTKAYGSLTVFVGFYAEVRYIFRVSRTCFYPVPKVDAAVIQLIPKAPPHIDAEPFFAFVRTTFSQRRKMLKNCCKERYPQVGEALDALSISQNVRAEELSLSQFLSLYHAVV